VVHVEPFSVKICVDDADDFVLPAIDALAEML